MSTVVRAENPPKSRRTPGSVADRVLADLQSRDQPVRPIEIAKKLDVPSGRVSNALRHLVLSGEAQRIRPEDGPANGPGTSLFVAC